MKSVYFLTAAILGLLTLPVQANVAEIADPRWEGIPNSGDTYTGAYFDANGIIQDNELIIYDLVSGDGAYTRLQTNCTTGESRHLRQGFFEARTRVNFGIINSDWYPDPNGIGPSICEYLEAL
jgi:hypothetical protein